MIMKNMILMDFTCFEPPRHEKVVSGMSLYIDVCLAGWTDFIYVWYLRVCPS